MRRAGRRLGRDGVSRGGAETRLAPASPRVRPPFAAGASSRGLSGVALRVGLCGRARRSPSRRLVAVFRAAFLATSWRRALRRFAGRLPGGRLSPSSALELSSGQPSSLPAALRAAVRGVLDLAMGRPFQRTSIDRATISIVSSIAYPNSDPGAASRPRPMLERRACPADCNNPGAPAPDQARQSIDRGGLVRHVER